MCDKENVCEECNGQGGDYGPNEIWVCNDCLPICLKCEAKLSTSYDKCCGKGRSDLSDEEEDEEEELSADKEEEELSADKEEEELTADKEEEELSADKEEEELSADEKDEELSADEKDEEISADEEEVIELEIDGKTYYCDGEEDGNIYEDVNGEVGNIVGELKDGEAIFH